MSKKTQTENVNNSTKTEPESTSTGTPGSTTENPTESQTTSQKAEASTSKGIFEEVTSTEPPVEGAPAVEGEEDDNAEEDTPVSDHDQGYELELSEDSPLTDAEFDEIVSEAERLKLSKADAEKLIQMREYSHKASKEAFDNEVKAKVDEMAKAYRKDETLHTVEAKLSMREAIKTFGTDPSFVEMFKDPMMNFHIPLAKFLISVGDRIRQGSNTVDVPRKSAGMTSGEEDPLAKAASNFYKDM